MRLPFGSLKGVAPWQALVAGLALVAAVVVSRVPAPDGAAPTAMLGLAVTLFTVILWATNAVPQPVTAALFFAAALTFAIAPPKAVLSGFTSNALGLVAGGLILGTAADKSGLGRIVARVFLGRFSGTYPKLILGILLGSVALAFLVPAAMARMAITVPIVVALCREVGYEHGTPGYYGAVLATTLGNFFISHAILPANLVNVLVAGSADTLYGLRFIYGEYALLLVPVIGLAKGALIYACLLWLFPAPPPGGAGKAAEPPPAFTPEARRLGVIIAAAIALWATDFLHGVAPGWVALAAGLACAAPGIGIVPWQKSLDQAKLTALFLVACMLGIGTTLEGSGASKLVASQIASLARIEGASGFYGYLVVAWLSALMALVATVVGAIAIMSPAVRTVAEATGLPIKTGMLAEVVGLQHLFFPYQTAPTMVGMALGRVPHMVGARLMIPVALIGMIVLIPLNGLWWRMIGAIP